MDFVTTDAVPDFIFVTEFVAKNVIFVTAATNRHCNSLIINYDYRVQKSPWKVHDFLHREIDACNLLIINYMQSYASAILSTTLTLLPLGNSLIFDDNLVYNDIILTSQVA